MLPNMRHAVSLLLLALLTFLTPLARAADGPLPLLADYRMQPDPAHPNRLVDSGPLGIHGALADGVSYAEGGRSGGKALLFSGQGSGMARVDDPKLLNRLGTPVTITAWVKPAALPGKNTWGAIVSKRTTNWMGKPFSLGVGDNGALVFEGTNGRDWNANVWTGPVFQPGEWTHVAVTCVQNGDRVLYVNGKEMDRRRVEGDLASNDQPLVLGREGDAPGRFTGLMGEVRIYAAALSLEQIQADMNASLPTRAATAADIAPSVHGVTLRLVRFDMPRGFTEHYGWTRQLAGRKAGPDAVDWPRLLLDGKPVFDKGAEETRFFPLRDDPQNRPLFRQSYDQDIEPGGHWFRALQWIWGQRYAYTTDRTARTWGAEYELWTFPILIKPGLPSALKNIVLRADGRVLYENPGPVRSLTLLLPQNEPGKPYELTVDGKGPARFDVGLKPIVVGSPKDELIPVNTIIAATRPRVVITNLPRPADFPNAKEWADDQAALSRAAAWYAAQNGADFSLPALAASFPMQPGSDATALVGTGPAKLGGKLLDGATYADGRGGRKALSLGGGKARAEVAGSETLNALTDEVSFTAWIRPDALPDGDYAHIVTKRPGWWTSKPFSLAINREGGLAFGGNNGDWSPNLDSPPAIKPGEWQHVAFTYRAGGDEVLYVNGREVAKKPAPRPLAGNSDPLVFGYEGPGDFPGGRYAGYRGLIQDARLYATALSPAQVAADMAGTLKTRAGIAGRAPFTEVTAPRQAKGPLATLGVEVPRSPITIFATSLTHGMSGGFKFHSEQGPGFPGGVDAYAAFLADLGFDRVYEQSGNEAMADPQGPNSYERWMQAMLDHGLQTGLNLLTLSDANQPFYGALLPDYHAPRFRDAQMMAQRFARFPNFAGAVMGADNAAYVPYWDWAPPIPNRPWGEAFLAFQNGSNVKATVAPGMTPSGAHEVVTATEREHLDYIHRYDETFRTYGYYQRALSEVDPRLTLTTGSFGSSPGVGGSGGFPWATAPGRAMFEGLPVLQSYDWNEQSSSKPLHNVALIDRLRSYYPDRPAWALLDDFRLFFGREAMQRAYALALTRGVKAVGTSFMANSENTKDRPGFLAAEKELWAWIHRCGGAYAMTEPLPTIGVLYVHEQAVSRGVGYSVKGPHEGKTTEALFVCHAAGWPAKIITPEEIQRGLPAGMKAILLTGLNRIDDSWHWYDGLEPKLEAFVKAGGRILCDDESACPVPATKTGMAISSYVTNRDMDWTPDLFERNRANIAALRKAMEGVAAPFCASNDPTVWSVPTRAGDTLYATVVNQASEPGQNASAVVKPQVGRLAWRTSRPIYDVRMGRRITPAEAASCDLTKDGFRYYALPPAPIEKLSVTADGRSNIRVAAYGGGKPMTGIPVEITVKAGSQSATLYSATGLTAPLPVTGPAALDLTVRELLSGKTARLRTAVPAPARTVSDGADRKAVARFLARRGPLAVALTPAQAADPRMRALAARLVKALAKKGRPAEVRTIAPGDVVLSLQPVVAAQRYPQWRTIDSDLVLLGSPADNVLLLDQARGFLLPPGIDRIPTLCVTHSPFVGERDALNIVAGDVAGLGKAADTLR